MGGDPLKYIDPLGLYRLVVGFEVNKPSAFAGGIHDLNIDYGHMFFYLVDENEKISETFSFGPSSSMTAKGEFVGIEGSIDYYITENTKLFNIDLNWYQYNYIKLKVKAKRANPPRYLVALNNTCAEEGLDIMNDLLLGIGLPSGQSKVKVPNHITGYTDGYLTDKGITKFKIVNPYALHSQMLAQGRTEYTLSSKQVTNSSSSQTLQTSILDPLLKYDKVKPTITITGKSNITIAHGSSYIEQGATAHDNIQGDIALVTSGVVNTNKVGSYTITYVATDAGGNSTTLSRVVTVTDQTAPTMKLNGNNTINISVGDTFTDTGVSISDNVDSGLSATVSGAVDTSKPGTYIIKYNVTDSSGNASKEIIRTIVVSK